MSEEMISKIKEANWADVELYEFRRVGYLDRESVETLAENY